MITVKFDPPSREELVQFRLRHHRRCFKSFLWAFRGLRYILATQTNFRIQLFFAAGSVLLAFVYPLTGWQRHLIILSCFLVLICESLNTALEYLVDLYEKKFSRQAMIAKDIAAAAVLLASCNALLQGVFIFIPYLYQSMLSLFKLLI